MRWLYASLLIALSQPVHAATETFNLKFVQDYAIELQSGFGFEDRCFFGQSCYPDGFRIDGGIFSDLEPGDTVTATLDRAAGAAMIGSWVVPGDVRTRPDGSTQFISDFPPTITEFNPAFVTVEDEGPDGFNFAGSCDPARPQAGLPSGFCGFFGYKAEFEVASPVVVPLPASAALLLGGLGLLAAARFRRRL